MGTKVTVGCKLPHGLHLEIGDTRVTVKGANAANIIGGHGITDGVDKEFFDAWMALNADHPAVKNELIFAHEKDRDTAAEAQEKVDNKTGFEGIDPNKPGNGVKSADEQKVGITK